MIAKLLVAFVLLSGATSVGLAQSQPNFGPNGPGTGDTFGKPPSGSAEARVPPGRYWNYAHRPHRHYRYR